MKPPKLSWSLEGVPIADRFDDPYFAKAGGLAETEHTYLAGNDLPARFRPDFCIAELGFGAGLNAAAALAAWRACGCAGRLQYVSFEAYPMAAVDMERALKAFPEIVREAALLVAFQAEGGGVLSLDDFDLTVILGDARETVAAWDGLADAWFLDGFSPAKNPELWEADLLMSVGAKTAAGGRFATYSSAGHIRRKLEAAGFEVERVPGFGTKRHMSRGRLRSTHLGK